MKLSIKMGVGMLGKWTINTFMAKASIMGKILLLMATGSKDLAQGLASILGALAMLKKALIFLILSGKAKVRTNTVMEIILWECLRIKREMGLEHTSMKMVTTIKVTGWIIQCMGGERSIWPMDHIMKEHGRVMRNMGNLHV